MNELDKLSEALSRFSTRKHQGEHGHETYTADFATSQGLKRVVFHANNLKMARDIAKSMEQTDDIRFLTASLRRCISPEELGTIRQR